MEKDDDIIPEHISGGKSNTIYSVKADSMAEANTLFKKAKQRLQNVNNWQKIAKGISANFKLTDNNGKEVGRNVKENDFFKIDVPGPGPAAGDGYDWVRVELIDDKSDPEADEEYYIIKVRPASSPLNNDRDIAHFFSREATSSFMVYRKGAEVIAGVYGRNEKPNTDVKTTTDKARNAMTGISAITAFSKLQWKSLVKGIIEDNN